MLCKECGGSGNIFKPEPCWEVNNIHKFHMCKTCWGLGTIGGVFQPPVIFIKSKGFPAPWHELEIPTKSVDSPNQSVSVIDFPNAAAVAVHFGIFPSLSQARKNGFNQELKSGDKIIFKKKGLIIHII